MPPWLVDLLLKSNSTGMVDSLSQLTGAHPSYVQLAPRVSQVGRGTQLGGDVSADQQGNLTVGLTPYTRQNFLRQDIRAGYTPNASSEPVQLGDAVIQHEFGHIAANGVLGDQLDQIDPDATHSEQFADHFQNAFQFLRSHKTDTSRLDSTTQKIIDVILAHPLYENHPINKARAREAQLKLLAGKPPS